MQDGASSHRISTILDRHFGQNWLGNLNHGAPIIWPSRSPDMTPLGKFSNLSTQFGLMLISVLDFSFWGVLRQKVYRRNPITIGELKRYIKEEASGFPLEYFMKTCNNEVLRRWMECKRSSGKAVENLYGIN